MDRLDELWRDDPFILEPPASDLHDPTDSKLAAERDGVPVDDIDVVGDRDDEDLPPPGYPNHGNGNGNSGQPPPNDGGTTGGGDPQPPPEDDDCGYEARRTGYLEQIARDLQRASELYAEARNIALYIQTLEQSTGGVSQEGDGETGFQFFIDTQWARYFAKMAEARQFEGFAEQLRAELELMRRCGS